MIPANAAGWLLGVRVAPGERVLGWALDWRVSPGWMVAGAGVAVAAAGWVYLRRARSWGLFALRAGLLGVMALALTGPAARLETELALRQQLLVLVDASRSMTIGDEVALGGAGGKAISRWDLVRSALPPALAGVGETCDVRVSLFGERVREGDVGTATPGDARTALGDAMSEALRRARGQPLAGMLLVTDGASNAGMYPLAVARAARVPVLAWGVGSPSATDLAVDDVEVAPVAFAGDEVTAQVRGRSVGLSGQSTQVRVELGGSPVASVPLRVGADGEFSLPVRFTPGKAGTFPVVVTAEALAGERIATNNTVTSRLRVIDGKIKVLYIERAPRWEFKYVQAILQRDRRVEATFVLTEGSASLAEQAGTHYAAGAPTSVEAYASFDLVILGDVDGGALPPGAVEALGTYVERLGGAVVFLAGHEHMPGSWGGGSGVERMLPVELSAAGHAAASSADPVVIDVTALGRAAGMLRLAPEADASAEIWKSLPPVYWVAEVARAKAASEVLLTAGGAGGGRPLMVAGRYGVGRTLFVGTDNLWRIRRNVGDETHARVWGQIVQGMGLPHLLGEGRRVQLSAGRSRYDAGGSAAVSARVFTAKFEPSLAPSISGKLTRPDKSVVAVTLVATSTPGTFQGSVELSMPGEYALAPDDDPAAAMALFARDADPELREIAMNKALLQDLARSTGGAFLTTGDLPHLAEHLKTANALSRSTARAELWNSPAVFLALLALASGEWIVRRKRGMK